MLFRSHDLPEEIMGEAAAIKGIPMPAPPLAPVSDDMQGECFRTPSFSRRVTVGGRATSGLQGEVGDGWEHAGSAGGVGPGCEQVPAIRSNQGMCIY